MLRIKKAFTLAMFMIAILQIGKTQCSHRAEQCDGPFPQQPVTPGLLEAVRAALNLPVGQCQPPYGTPPEEGCFAPTEKILARTMMMDFLWELRNFTVDNDHPVAAMNEGTRAQYDRYVESIVAMVRTNTSFINLAGKRFAGSSRFRYNDTYFCLIRQVTTDINAAYECAGLPAPVIQGAVMEVVDLHLTEMQVRICPDVINTFIDEIVAAGLENDYFNRENNGTVLVARTDKFFKRENIVFSVNADPQRPDGNRPNIVKVECQMFFYHCAKLQMDAGYTSLAMGYMADWAAADNEDGELNTTHSVLKKIRAYAKTIDQKMLITAEPGKDLKNYVPHPSIPGAKQFLFDFGSIPLRPREINLAHPHVDSGTPDCDYPYVAQDIAIFQTAPCLADQALGAVFDECTIDAFNSHNDIEGYTPNGCLTTGLPYVVYFDYAEGEKRRNCIHPNELIGFPDFEGPGDEGPGTWGYADCNWLEQLTPACRAAWFRHTFCRIRELTNGNGFMQIPGLVFLPHRNPDCMDDFDHDPFERSWFCITDDANLPLLNAAIEVTTVTATPPIINQERYLVEEWCDKFSACADEVARPGFAFQMKKHAYRFCVENTDCTSFYTWHIRKQDGTWLPIERGNCFDFNPAEEGTYIVGLRADNTGFPGTWGALLTPADVTVTIAPECTELPIELADCWRLNTDCPVRENDVVAYDFEITMDAAIRPVDVHLTSTVGTLSSSAFDATSGVVTGKYKLPVETLVKRFDVIMEYKPTAYSSYQTMHIIKELDGCQQAFELRSSEHLNVPITLKPNPSNDFFVVDGIESGTRYEILNSAGSTFGAGSCSAGDAIRVANYAPGLYFVKLISPNRATIVTQKLVIAHKN